MSNTTSAADVRGMFERTCRAAQSAGVDSSAWVLQEGSVTYGRAWRLFSRDATTGGLRAVGAADYLGSNRREAYGSLYGMARAFELVTYGAQS